MANSKDTYLVAGGSGFLGRHIVEALQARGDSVSAFDLVQKYDDTPFYTGDISEPTSIVSAIKQSGATCLFHTVSPIPNTGNNSLYHRVNVEGTRNIIDAAISCNVRKLIFTSSAGVVFEGRDIADADEQTPYPRTALDVYTETKAEAEQLVIAANGKHGLLTVSLRPASIYGPGDRQAFPGFLNAYKRQQTHVQIGNNTNLFDWTYVDNLVHAHLLAADQLTSGSGVAGEIFFITNGDPIPFWDFPRMIWSRLAAAGVKPVPPVRKPFVMPKFVGMIVGFIMEYIAYFTGKQATFTRFSVTFCCATRWHNISKARRILGYRPLINNEDGVERMVNWWLAEQAKAS